MHRLHRLFRFGQGEAPLFQISRLPESMNLRFMLKTYEMKMAFSGRAVFDGITLACLYCWLDGAQYAWILNYPVAAVLTCGVTYPLPYPR